MTPAAAQLWTFVIACLAGGALLLAPEAGDVIRGPIRDALTPGQRVVAWCSLQGKSLVTLVREQFTTVAPAPESQALQLLLKQAQQELQRVQLEAAELRQQLKDERQRASAGLPASTAKPLYQADLLTVHVLGTEAAASWRSRPLLGAGTGDGLRESALVLDDSRPLLDAGSDSQLSPDQPVFAGGTVVGKIVRVGRFSSTLCPVTDPTFTGSARLVRRSGQHVEYGAAGTLKGDGSETCALVRIPADEPVGVGDLVVTIDTDGLLPPQVYGEVVKAEPPEGTLEWKIRVRPTPRLGSKVHVLRIQLNPERTDSESTSNRL